MTAIMSAAFLKNKSKFLFPWGKKKKTNVHQKTEVIRDIIKLFA